jgi:hypothetical protein
MFFYFEIGAMYAKRLRVVNSCTETSPPRVELSVTLHQYQSLTPRPFAHLNSL